MTGPTGHAPVGIWIRDKYRALDRTLSSFKILDVIFFVCSLAPFLEQIADLSGKSTLSREDWFSLGGRLVLSIPAGAAIVLSKRNTDNYQSGLKDGSASMAKDWEKANRGLISSLSSLMEVFDGRTMRVRDAPGNDSIYQAMVSIRKTVIAVFDDIQEDSLTLTLGVSNKLSTEMKIVILTPESGDRKKGNTYPLPTNADNAHSMTRAYLMGKPNFTADAHQHPDLVGKRYRSILSLPIKSVSGTIIGVVNIDSPIENAFSKGRYVGENARDTPLQIVHDLSQAALKVIGLALENTTLFRDYRDS